MLDVRIPDMGEVSNVEVIEICVKPGDEVSSSDILIVLESEKASMEVPAPESGKVVDVSVNLGDTVKQGDLIARLDGVDAAAEREDDPSSEVDGKPPREQASPAPVGAPAPPAAHVDPAPPAPAAGVLPPQPAASAAVPAGTSSGVSRHGRVSSTADVYAGPAVRRLARELGVDLHLVRGSGQKNRVIREDVCRYVAGALHDDGMEVTARDEDFALHGEIEVVPESRIRQRTAANLHASWRQAVHVTQHEEADITDLESFRQQLNKHLPERSVRLTPLAFIAGACTFLLREHPRLNGSLVNGGRDYVFKRYVHLGIAVDTPDGLLVPVIRDADRKGITELAKEMEDLSHRARTRKLKPEEMRGASFTISSLGRLGGTGFTRIITAPEVAVRGVASLTDRPVFVGRKCRRRTILPFSLSYDHRAINGVEAGRFTFRLAELLADIRKLLL